MTKAKKQIRESMSVRLHRWQPKQNRYKIQNLALEPGETSGEVITDILFRRAMFENDATVDQIIARTQQVDRVMVNALNNTVDIWMSPTVERVYNKTSIAVAGKASGFKKPTAADHLCDCNHALVDHSAKDDHICLVPGCACKEYLEPLRERLERPGRVAVPARPITAADPITNDDVGI